MYDTVVFFFFFQAEDGIRDWSVTGVQTCALPISQERLPPARSLTVHELTRAARLPGESDRERLRELATTCERVRFGDQQESSSTLAAAIARGRELLAALEAPARERQEAGRAHA